MNDDAEVIKWPKALKILGISYASHYRRMREDADFRALRFTLFVGPHGKNTYAARLSEVRAYLERMKQQHRR